MDKEKQDLLCDNFMKELIEEGRKIQEADEALLKECENIKPKIREHINYALEDCSRGYMLSIPFEMVSEPKGKYDREYKAWVNQWGVGMDGDSWEGNMYFKIEKGRYLKAFYSC